MTNVTSLAGAARLRRVYPMTPGTPPRSWGLRTNKI
jgi:hypothetical protein